ncbi:MAG: CPBP family intramembrane metalloprotease [Lachnospiraceae bacterium]|nr:CPBP family intramembrane metalloprotease [Lachnospiraceae bacterium]
MEKKKLWIFLAVAYGVTALMSIIMYMGFKRQYDITLFVNAQMMYPACGVIMGKLICRREDEELPLAGFVTVLITTAIMMLMAILSVVVHLEPLEVAGQTIDIWNTASQFPILLGSLVAYILFWTCGKKKRESVGIERKNIKRSILMIAVFVALLIGRIMLWVVFEDLRLGSDESLQRVLSAAGNPLTWLTVAMLPVNFVLTFIAFFGEEYGWRYYLQPIMQNRFGKRIGVLLLGVVWSVWHMDVDFMYYAKDYALQAFVSQIIVCLAISIFFGYAYMKTQNIWVPMIMHYLFNNVTALLAGGGTDALEDQVIEWSILPGYALSFIVFFLFILAPMYKKSKDGEDGIIG